MRRRSQRGFTLVEIMVALVLGAIAMIGVIGLYRTSTNASSFSRHTTEATILGQDQLERLRTQQGAPAPLIELTLDETGKTGTGIYTRTSTVVAETINVPAQYFEIVIVVAWTEEGAARSVTVRGRRSAP